MLSAYLVCRIYLLILLTNYVNVWTNHVDLDQTAPTGAVWYEYTLFCH